MFFYQHTLGNITILTYISADKLDDCLAILNTHALLYTVAINNNVRRVEIEDDRRIR